jgi:hypothetical protein
MTQSTETTVEGPEETLGEFTMVVTLKSGTQIRTQVTAYTVGRNGLGALARLKWAGADGADAALQYIDLEEVAAVHSEGLA